MKRSTWLWIEAVLCFGPLTVVLVLGTVLAAIYSVGLVALLFSHESTTGGSPLRMLGGLLPLALVSGGVAGLLGLSRLRSLLEHEDRGNGDPRITLALVLIGVLMTVGGAAPLIQEWTNDGDNRDPFWTLVLCGPPLVATAHWLYLARAPLSAAWRRSR